MKDNLRADPDLDLDLDDDRAYRPLSRNKPRSANWLAWQIALGIIIGGCTLWVLDVTASFIAAKFMLGQLQISMPGVTR